MCLRARRGAFAGRALGHSQLQHHLTDPDTMDKVPVQLLPLETMGDIYPSRHCQSDRLLRLAHNEYRRRGQGYHQVLAIRTETPYTSNGNAVVADVASTTIFGSVLPRHSLMASPTGGEPGGRRQQPDQRGWSCANRSEKASMRERFLPRSYRPSSERDL